LERPAVGIATGCSSQGGSFSYRVWAGAIVGRPMRLDTLESALHGVPPGGLMDVLPKASLEAAATLPAQDDLHGSADYKQHLAAVFMRRAVAQAAGVSVEERADA
jgi:CO/xanthine dehydrogenase FAD-binding subunit